MKQSIDIHQHVTDLIIAAIESGVSEPKLPWDRLGLSNMLPRNALSRATYRGINIVSLWASALAHNFEHGIWATFEQWRSLDCSVRDGAMEKTAYLAVVPKKIVKPGFLFVLFDCQFL